MRALVWHGKEEIRYDTMSDPTIEHLRDTIIEVTSCAIRGSDLHLVHHLVPATSPGDIMGHEARGEVDSAAKGKLETGDRVVIPFTILCGESEQRRRGNASACEQTDRTKELGDTVFADTAHGTVPYGIAFEQESVVARPKELTGGKGPHDCIDALGMESHVGSGQPHTVLDRAEPMPMGETDRPYRLREMIDLCRPAGLISIIGVPRCSRSAD